MFIKKRFSILLLLVSVTLNAADVAPKFVDVVIKTLTGQADRVSIPVSGSLKDIREAYKVELSKQGRPIPGDYEVKIVLAGKDAPDFKYTLEDIMGVGAIHAVIHKKEGSTLTSSSRQQPAEPAWYSAPSKSKYFTEKYKRFVAAISLADVQDYTGIQANSSLHTYLKELVGKMGALKPYIVIQEMLKKADEKPYSTILAQLPGCKNVQAIAALQKINGNGDALEYNEKLGMVDPLLGQFTLTNGAQINMTLYRLLYSIIQELDDVHKATPIKKDSALYNFLYALDQAL